MTESNIAKILSGIPPSPVHSTTYGECTMSKTSKNRLATGKAFARIDFEPIAEIRSTPQEERLKHHKDMVSLLPLAAIAAGEILACTKMELIQRVVASNCEGDANDGNAVLLKLLADATDQAIALLEFMKMAEVRYMSAACVFATDRNINPMAVQS
jgi:hypothetical protein